LQLATAAYAALCVGVLTSAGSLPLLLMLTGLLASALALRLAETMPAASAPALEDVPEGDPADKAPAAAPDRACSAPGPLPFMGDRIVLEPQLCATSGLAEAARRVNRATVMKRHGWKDLMARVSHELRTPLNAVIGFSDVMNAELLGPVGHPRYREYARHIRDCGRELLKSAEDTLAITCLLEHHGQHGRSPAIELASVAADAWSFFLEEAARRAIRLELTVPEGLELLSERRPLRQILINLFSEAIDRAGDKGLVTLSACADGDLVQLEVMALASGRSQTVAEASLSICLARALLELQGAALIEIDDPSCTWRAVTVLSCAAQPDFFELPHAFAPRPAHVC
jgi:signal transduction histidine kinase